jgi:hypothetical protein
VPPPAGHSGVLARGEGFAAESHSQATIGPLFVRFSKWMCACRTSVGICSNDSL